MQDGHEYCEPWKPMCAHCKADAYAKIEEELAATKSDAYDAAQRYLAEIAALRAQVAALAEVRAKTLEEAATVAVEFHCTRPTCRDLVCCSMALVAVKIRALAASPSDGKPEKESKP